MNEQVSSLLEKYPNLHPLKQVVYLSSPVIRGFGRGGKQLGIPTANLDVDHLGASLESLDPGIYFGWASIEDHPDISYMMVMSVGWNPVFGNQKKSCEPHLLHKFDEDFYGANLKVVVTGYLRPELKFDSLEALIAGINDDITISKYFLAQDPHSSYRDSAFLRE